MTGKAMRSLGLAVYAFVLAIWTWLLVKPQPVPESLVGGIAWFDPEMLFFLLAKATHFTVYAGFAFLGGWLVRGRWIVVALVLHGAASELGQWIGSQHFDTKRHGCVRDVLIDAAGIAVGSIFVRQRRNSPPPA
jgi:hypothetical protein